MKIIEKKLNEIYPYKNNPRINNSAINSVKNSIKEFGFKVPIVIDKNGEIICGHTRYKAAKALNLESVPCVIADDLTEEEAKAFRIADNKIQEKSDWDTRLLSEELFGICENYDMMEFGFEKRELNLLLGILDEDDTDESKEKKQTAPQCENKKRIIITYSDDEADLLKKMLKEDGEIKQSYTIKKILGGMK